MIPELVTAVERVGIGAVAVGALIWFVLYKTKIDDGRNKDILSQAKNLTDDLMKQALKREEYLMSLNENGHKILNAHTEQIKDFQSMIKNGLDYQRQEHNRMIEVLDNLKLTLETISLRLK